MAAHVRIVEILEAGRRELRRRARAKGAPARVVERARIVLLAGEGVPRKQIAARVGCAEPTVVTWRPRYAKAGLTGLADLPRPGSPSPLPEKLRDRVLELTLTQPPTQYGATHWSSRLLAAALAPTPAKHPPPNTARPGPHRSLVVVAPTTPGPGPRRLPGPRAGTAITAVAVLVRGPAWVTVGSPPRAAIDAGGRRSGSSDEVHDRREHPSTHVSRHVRGGFRIPLARGPTTSNE
jgi:transposase